jgi:hypothetical protein
VTKIVTFYSFKGGVGRTMALVNTAYVLARDGYRVLMVDFDLEAPGMTYFFAAQVERRPPQVQRDALDLLLEAKRSFAKGDPSSTLHNTSWSLAECVINVALPVSKHEYGRESPYLTGRLDLLPATLNPVKDIPGPEPAQDYLSRLDAIDLPGIFGPDGPGHRFGNYLRQFFLGERFDAPGDILFALRDHIRAAYDFVLIDSRTGLNEISGLCIGPLCDGIAICCGLNRQNIEGTEYFMEKAGLLSGDEAKPFFLIAGPVPPWNYGKSKRKISALRERLKLKEVIEIPYHPTAALEETIFVENEPSEQISAAYERIGPVIVQMFTGKDYVIPDEVSWESYALHLASMGSEVRLARRQGPRSHEIFLSIGGPTSCALSALVRRPGYLRETGDLIRIPFAAAVAAYRLCSREPFQRAREWISNSWNKGMWGRIAHLRLSFFEARWRGKAVNRRLGPAKPPKGGEVVLSKLLEDIWEADRAVVWIASRHEPSPKMQNNLRKWMLNYQGNMGWSDASDDLSRRWMNWWRIYSVDLLQGILSESLSPKEDGRIREGLDDRPYLSFFENGEPIVNLTTKFAQWSTFLPPLGLWEEPLMASVLARVEGENAIDEILMWIKLARISYGYAWRVLVDWRHLDKVKTHPSFRQFIQEEDELVNKIESGIDQGIYPL